MFNKAFLFLACCLFLASCATPENQAITDWESGRIESAEEKFGLIEKNYEHTVAAADSFRERASLKEDYQEKYSLKHAERDNRGPYSSQMVKAIDAYYRYYQRFPDDLSAVAATTKYYLLCEYRALFDYG